MLAYLDDITVVCEEDQAEVVIDCMETALARAGLQLNLSKLCVFTASLQRPPGRQAGQAWEAQPRHDGFTLLGTPTQPEGRHGVEGAAATPVGSPAYVEDWLKRRLAKVEALARQLGAAPGLVKADLPAAQGFSQLARQCFAQQQAHLARGLLGATCSGLPGGGGRPHGPVNSLPCWRPGSGSSS